MILNVCKIDGHYLLSGLSKKKKAIGASINVSESLVIFIHACKKAELLLKKEFLLPDCL